MRVKHRSLIAILVLNVITLGLYQIYWFFITKTEMNTINSRELKVPFFLWYFISIINIWWFYRFCKALNATTKNRISTGLAFFLPAIIALIYAGVMSLFFGVRFVSFATADFSAITILLGLNIITSLVPILIYQHYLNKVARTR